MVLLFFDVAVLHPAASVPKQQRPRLEQVATAAAMLVVTDLHSHHWATVLLVDFVV